MFHCFKAWHGNSFFKARMFKEKKLVYIIALV